MKKMTAKLVTALFSLSLLTPDALVLADTVSTDSSVETTAQTTTSKEATTATTTATNETNEESASTSTTTSTASEETTATTSSTASTTSETSSSTTSSSQTSTTTTTSSTSGNSSEQSTTSSTHAPTSSSSETTNTTTTTTTGSVTPSVPVQPAPVVPAAPSFPTVEPVDPAENDQDTVNEVDLDTQTFVVKIGEEARDIADKNHLYASVMIAQAILESASGSSDLAKAPNYNLFGVKGNYKGKSVYFHTLEDNGLGNLYSISAGFRKYPSYKESLQDYAALLTKPVGLQANFYEGAWKTKAKTYKEATAYLTGRYATDTAYNQKLNKLIETYHLTDYDKPLTLATQAEKEQQAVKKELVTYLGVKYLWGGTTPKGFDCSGLVQYVYKKALKVELPRVTTQQETVGQTVDLNHLQTGDLLFYGEKGQTYHVGIYIGNGLFIHAPEPGDHVKITKVKDFKPSFAKRIIKETPKETKAN